MYQLTLNTPDWDTMKLAHAARRLYMADVTLSLPEYVEVTRRFSDFYNKSKGDQKVEELRADIATYQEKLESLHLQDSQVREEWTVSHATWKLIDRLIFLLILLPLALPGFLVNGPVIFIGKCMNYLTPYLEAKATFKLMASFIVMTVVYFLMSLFVWFYFQLPFLACIILLPILGVMHIHILEEEVSCFKTAISSLRIISVILRNTQREELKQLRSSRTVLEKRVAEMVDQYATPEQRTLKIEGEHMANIGPKLVRRNSFSQQML